MLTPSLLLHLCSEVPENVSIMSWLAGDCLLDVSEERLLWIIDPNFVYIQTVFFFRPLVSIGRCWYISSYRYLNLWSFFSKYSFKCTLAVLKTYCIFINIEFKILPNFSCSFHLRCILEVGIFLIILLLLICHLISVWSENILCDFMVFTFIGCCFRTPNMASPGKYTMST